MKDAMKSWGQEVIVVAQGADNQNLEGGSGSGEKEGEVFQR